MATQTLKARAQVQVSLPGDYLLRQPSDDVRPRELVLLLHGFRQSGEYMMRKLGSRCPDDFAVLAPCAPYPLPERSDGGELQLGFSWYFYNAAKDSYYIDMAVAVDYLAGLVEGLGLSGLPKRIAGFSQGGYIAPIVASRLGGVSQVIGLGSQFLSEEMTEHGIVLPPAFRCDSLHGEDDEIVKLSDARESYGRLQAQGTRGEMQVFAGVGHRIAPPMAEAFGKLLLAERG
jgi:predicted esterase